MTLIRRSEFACESMEVVHEVLDGTLVGYLATLDPAGHPVARPMNFARVGERLYIHGSSHGELGSQLAMAGGLPASFVVAQALAWVPSAMRHPELACPATTYYRSVLVRGRLEPVRPPVEKAEALAAFMRRYQPAGGYRPLSADDPLYRGPLASVLVASLPLTEVRCKVKVGQHLEPGARRAVFEGLLRRNAAGDYEAARHMAAWDPSLALGATLFPREEGGLSLTDSPAAVPVDELHALLAGTYWAAGRSRREVERSVVGSYVVLAALDPRAAQGRDPCLIAFCRVVSDGVLHGWIYDVVVHPSSRGRGVGGTLLRRVLAHPKLAGVARLHLTTADAMGFYEALGFCPVTCYPAPWGSSTLMVLDRSPAGGRGRGAGLAALPDADTGRGRAPCEAARQTKPSPAG